MKTAKEYIDAKNRRLEINNEIRELETKMGQFREVMSIIFLPLYFNIEIYDKANNGYGNGVRAIHRAIDNCIIKDNSISVLFQSKRELGFSMEPMIQTEFIVNRDALAKIIELYDPKNLEPAINLAYEYFRQDQALTEKHQEHSDAMSELNDELEDLENTINQLAKLKIPDTDPTMQKVVAEREEISQKLITLGEAKVKLAAYNVLPMRIGRNSRYLLPDGHERSSSY